MSNPILEGLHEIAQGQLYSCECFWTSVEPRYSEVPRDWEKVSWWEFVVSRFFSIHFTITGMKNIALNRGLRLSLYRVSTVFSLSLLDLNQYHLSVSLSGTVRLSSQTESQVIAYRKLKTCINLRLRLPIISYAAVFSVVTSVAWQH